MDVSVYGSFKRHLASMLDVWLCSNPGKTIAMYDIPQLVATTLPLPMTPTKLMTERQEFTLKQSSGP